MDGDAVCHSRRTIDTLRVQQRLSFHDHLKLTRRQGASYKVRGRDTFGKELANPPLILFSAIELHESNLEQRRGLVLSLFSSKGCHQLSSITHGD